MCLASYDQAIVLGGQECISNDIDWIFKLQAGEYYSINFEIEAAMKAEKIDLQGGSGSDLTGDNNGQYGSSSSVSDYNTKSDTDPFRSGPLDYTL